MLVRALRSKFMVSFEDDVYEVDQGIFAYIDTLTGYSCGINI